MTLSVFYVGNTILVLKPFILSMRRTYLIALNVEFKSVQIFQVNERNFTGRKIDNKYNIDGQYLQLFLESIFIRFLSRKLPFSIFSPMEVTNSEMKMTCSYLYVHFTLRCVLHESYSGIFIFESLFDEFLSKCL